MELSLSFILGAGNFLDGVGIIRFKFLKELGLKMFLILQVAKAEGF